jgi:hypothetical protein
MIIWADGFDHYGTGGAGQTEMLAGAYADSSSGPTAAQHRTGTYSLPFNGTNDQTRRVFGSALTTVGVAGAFYLSALPATNQACALFSFRDGANKPQLTIELQTTGIIAAWRGNHTVNYFDTLLGSSSGALVAPSSWNHIEVKATFDTTTGSVEVRLNGVTVLNLTGVDTCNSEFNVESASQVVFGFLSNDSGRTMYLDDLVAWDTAGTYNNDFIGDQKVFTDMPDADTADVDWTPSAGGQRYAMIDEIPADGDATYDETLTTGNRMGVTFPDLDAAVVSVSALLFYAKTRKTDAGVCNLQVSAQSGAAEDAGADNPITTAYTYRWDVFEVDPNTSAPWAPAAASAAAMVIERTA